MTGSLSGVTIGCDGVGVDAMVGLAVGADVSVIARVGATMGVALASGAGALAAVDVAATGGKTGGVGGVLAELDKLQASVRMIRITMTKKR